MTVTATLMEAGRLCVTVTVTHNRPASMGNFNGGRAIMCDCDCNFNGGSRAIMCDCDCNFNGGNRAIMCDCDSNFNGGGVIRCEAVRYLLLRSVKTLLLPVPDSNEQRRVPLRKVP